MMRALLHIDGDGFFASCEQAINPALKNQPVVTGKERNIIAAASYEAKALGIGRGMTLRDAQKICPQLVILPSNYELYGIISKRMYAIIRRYTPTVEEYSIDEAFCDITGLRRVHRGSYEMIAQKIQQDIHDSLGITVSLGLSISKTLCKVASKRHKPAGFTAISDKNRLRILADTEIGDVWNIGGNTAALLKQYGIYTAADFAQKEEHFVRKIVTKPGVVTWQELNGHVAIPLTTLEKTSYQSIGKTKTFTPPSNKQEYVYAQLVKNLENACFKARKYKQAPKKITVWLRERNFRSYGVEASLIRPSAFPLEVLSVVDTLFKEIFIPGTEYRATGIILSDLQAGYPTQISLFEPAVKIQSIRRLYEAVDDIREKHGKYTIHHGARPDMYRKQHVNSRGDLPLRERDLLKGETKRRRLSIPLLEIRVS